jgi:hypothetical protein
MEDSIHHPKSVEKSRRGRGRAMRNVAFGNPSAQEMKNGLGKENTDR